MIVKTHQSRATPVPASNPKLPAGTARQNSVNAQVVEELLAVVNAHKCRRDSAPTGSGARHLLRNWWTRVYLSFASIVLVAVVWSAMDDIPKWAAITGYVSYLAFVATLLTRSILITVPPMTRTLLRPWDNAFPEAQTRIVHDAQLLRELVPYDTEVLEFAKRGLLREAEEFANRTRIFFGALETTGIAVSIVGAWAGLEGMIANRDQRWNALMLLAVFLMLALTGLLHIRDGLNRYAGLLEGEIQRRSRSLENDEGG